MKRLFSLLLLLWCSLTLYGISNAQQTWRLTSDANGDVLPKITIDNAGQAWVVWLSNATGNYDVYCQHFAGSSWSSSEQLCNDTIDQHHCALTYDPFAGIVYAAWDSSGYVMLAGNNGVWSSPEKVNPDGPVLNNVYPDDADFAIDCSDSGYLHVAWSGWTGYSSYDNVALRTCKRAGWDTVQITTYLWALFSEVYIVKGIASSGMGTPVSLSHHDWSSMGMNNGDEIAVGFFDDSLGYWNSWPACVWNLRPLAAIGIRYLPDGRIMACYQDSTVTAPIVGIILTAHLPQVDTTTIILQGLSFQSGALTKTYKPTLAWSDSHSVFLNTYYDTLWSHPPVRISDTSLHNCINPDIVAENDSTVWVCYQNDGDIYVTRTSVPLGISGSANSGDRRPRSISLKAWPNPASNVIHFSYTLPNTHNSSVSIFDIAGRLVKVLEIKNAQIHWNCADNAGRKVASGVYFARLTSDGQETIKRISIIK